MTAKNSDQDLKRLTTCCMHAGELVLYFGEILTVISITQLKIEVDESKLWLPLREKMWSLCCVEKTVIVDSFDLYYMSSVGAPIF